MRFRAFLMTCAMGSIASAAQAQTDTTAAQRQPMSGSATARSSAGAAASEVASEPAGPQLAEVVVTARRRAENIQSVPVAVTALSGAALIRGAITSIADLSESVPALTTSPGSTGGRSSPSFAIRGQRQQDAIPSVDNSVAIYFGDIVAARTVGVDQTLYDVNSVEVLKGPQGTLFGRNTTGGAIVIRPNLPSQNFSADLLAGAGDYSANQIQGMINVPLGDKAALRIAGQHVEHDGYMRDVTTGRHDLQDENANSIRISLRLQPVEHLESTTIADYFNRQAGGTGYEIISARATGTQSSAIFGPYLQGVLAQQQGRSIYDTALTAQPYVHSETYSAQNTTSYVVPDTPLGSLTFKNIAGYRHILLHSSEDFDGSPLDLLSYKTNSRGGQFSEEFQIVGDDKNTNWIVGAYYFREQVFYSNLADVLAPALTGIVSPQYPAETDRNNSVSGFAQVTQNLDVFLNGLSLTGGLRYTSDSKTARFGTTYNEGVSFGSPTAFPNPPVSNPSATSPTGFASIGQFCSFAPATYSKYMVSPDCNIVVSKDSNAITYNLSTDYKVAPGKLIYISTQRGYRSGGINTRNQDPVDFNPTFKPETVQNYEAGAKLDFDFSGMRLRTNVAAYHQDYNDVQRLVQVNTAGGGVATNVVNANAGIDGGELEATFLPTRDLELSGSMSLVDAHYKAFKFVQPTTGATVDLTNTPFAGVPSQTYNLQGRYTLPIPGAFGEAVLQATYYWQGRTYWQDIFEPEGRVASYDLINLRLEWNKILGHPIDAAFFINNVADNHYFVSSLTLEQQIGFTSAIPGAPRTIGFQLHYHWGGR